MGYRTTVSSDRGTRLPPGSRIVREWSTNRKRRTRNTSEPDDASEGGVDAAHRPRAQTIAASAHHPARPGSLIVVRREHDSKLRVPSESSKIVEGYGTTNLGCL